MSNLLEDYESYLTTEKKASANTVSSYLRDVHQFAQEMEERDVPLDEVLPRDVEDYIRGLTRRGKSAATVTRSVASIKSFYNCLLSRGLVESNPARNVTAAKGERKLPQILTSREVELFLEQPDCSDLKGYRDRAMLELLYATGIRVSELIELDVDDLNLYAGVLHCASKGKERVIPLYPAAIRALEETYAKLECPIVSNNSAHRWTEDVPMVVPEINAEHLAVIEAQRKRLGTKRGFIAVKSNCSLQSYVPALHPLMKYGLERALVCTYQAISGAGKTFQRWPEMVDNCIPYIGGEEEKSEQEPLKLWGHIDGDKIVPATAPSITAQCLRVPVSDGHMGAVFVSFDKKPTKEEILKTWKEFHGPAQDLDLPSAPKQFLHYFEEDDRPQPKLDRMIENGMAVSIGRLREDTQYDYKFVCLSHNTLRGAAGGAVLLAELLAVKGYFD